MKTIKVKKWYDIPGYYTGIAEDDVGNKYWYLDSKLHRIDGPAVEYTDGSKYWFLNDEYHRENGPACEDANGTKSWFLNGKLHRIDGPAVECVDGYKTYWINGKEVTKEAQEVLYAMYKLKGLL